MRKATERIRLGLGRKTKKRLPWKYPEKSTRHIFCLQIPNLTLKVSYSYLLYVPFIYKIHPLPQFTRLLLLQRWLL